MLICLYIIYLYYIIDLNVLYIRKIQRPSDQRNRQLTLSCQYIGSSRHLALENGSSRRVAPA